ncbi:MAG: HAD family hydrolase [Ignisphaera sp.]
MIMGVVFDLDGTLVDSVEVHVYAWKEACKALGIVKGAEDEEKFVEFVRGLVGLAPIDIAYNITKDMQMAQRLAEVKQRIYLSKIGEVKIFPGVDKALENLKKMGLRIAIASSVPRKVIESVIKANNIARYIDAYVGSDEVSKRKPDPEMFLKALERIGVEPTNAVIVGDTEYDIAPANRIGAVSILICWRRCLETKASPRFIAKNIDDVVNIIQNLVKQKPSA